MVVPAFLSGADDDIEVRMRLFLGLVLDPRPDLVHNDVVVVESDVYDEDDAISEDYYVDTPEDSMGGGAPVSASGPSAQEDRAPEYETRLQRWRNAISRCCSNRELPDSVARTSHAIFRVCEARQLRKERAEDSR